MMTERQAMALEAYWDATAAALSEPPLHSLPARFADDPAIARLWRTRNANVTLRVNLDRWTRGA